MKTKLILENDRVKNTSAIPFSIQTKTIQMHPLINSAITIAVEDMYGSTFFVREYLNNKTKLVVCKTKATRLNQRKKSLLGI